MKHAIKTVFACAALFALVACSSPLGQPPTADQSLSAARAISAGFSGDVTIKALANGRFVCADLDQGAKLLSNRDAAQGWETFTLESKGGNDYALKARANGKYVCADLDLGGKLVANRDAAQGWEIFTLESKGGDDYALKAKANGKYVCAENAGAAQLVANRDAAQGWETFTIVAAGPNPSPTPSPGFTWNNPSIGSWINGSQANGSVAAIKTVAWEAIIPPMTGMKIVNNTWGIPDNGYGDCAVFAEDVKGTYTFGWSWNLTQTKPNSVIVYPEIGWGWSPNSGGWFNGATVMNKISDNKKYLVDMDLKRTNRSGSWNTAFDVWLYPMQNPTGGSGGGKGGYEIMIWFDHEVQGPWGSNPQPVTINGRNWLVYDNDGSAGWRVISYIVQGAGIESVRNYDLSAFFNDAANRYANGTAHSIGLSRSHYINAVEFGSESCGGTGMLEVANYKLSVQ